MSVDLFGDYPVSIITQPVRERAFLWLAFYAFKKELCERKASEG